MTSHNFSISNTGVTIAVGTAYDSIESSSPSGFSEVGACQFLVFYLVFMDHCLSFLTAGLNTSTLSGSVPTGWL